jgi:type VI protein secretion system component Hcp
MSKPVIISAISAGEREVVDGKPTDRFTEKVSLSFATVNFEYTGQKEDQSKGASVSSGDLQIAKKG